MNDPARDALVHVLTEYGVSVLDTPRFLATLLHQHAKMVPQDVDALLAAVHNNIPTQIRTNPQHDPGSLVRVLVQIAKLSPGKADWAVRTWSAALASASRPPPVPQKSPSLLRVIAVLVGAAGVGMLGYMMFIR